jgi:NAD(P)-dependent dehydrogenase (short-subunit alcohol dehydrogenase family)
MSTSQAPSAFGASSTAAEVIDAVDLHGRRAVVTGAGSGIGVETVRALATAGADVTLAVRDTDAGATVADRLRAELPPESGKLSVARLELSDLSSIKAFAASWDGPLHILVNNAGVMAPPRIARTAEGWEWQLGVNHLGHFALTTSLHPALAAANGARIVAVSSIGHLFSPVVFDDLDYRYRPYDPWTSYGQSKTAVIHFAVAAERWTHDGITANAVMPGNVAGTALARNTDMQAVAAMMAAGELAQRAGATHGIAPYALDPENAARLWTVSEALTRYAAVGGCHGSYNLVTPPSRASSPDSAAHGLRPTEFEDGDGAHADGLAFVFGEARVAPRLLGVDTVALIAGQFADGDAVGLGAAFDAAVSGSDQVVVPVRIDRRPAPGREDVDGVRLALVREVHHRADVLAPALAAAVVQQDDRRALEDPADLALVRPELRDGVGVPVERLAHVELPSRTIPRTGRTRPARSLLPCKQRRSPR